MKKMLAYKVFIERNERIYSFCKHVFDNLNKNYVEYSKTSWNDRKFPIKNSGPFCAFDNLDAVHNFLLCFAKYNIIYSVYQIEAVPSLKDFVWENYNNGIYTKITNIHNLASQTLLVERFKIIKLIYQTTGWE